MKKKILYIVFPVIIVGIIGWFVSGNDLSPPITPQETLPKEKKYTGEQRKQILLVMIEKDPELWRERYILGGIYLQEGDFDQAAEQFKKIIVIRPGMIKAYNALGMCYLNLGRNNDAVTVWKKSLEIDPENAPARDFVTRIEQIEKRTQERRKLEILLEKNPNHPDMWFRLGEIYLTEKLHGKAIDSFKKASQLSPDRADYLYKLGYTYHRTRDYSQAESALKSAQILDPQNDKIKRLLLDAQAKKRK